MHDLLPGEQVMTYALDGGRLTWNVAVPWAAADLDQLQNRRYITDGSDARSDPRGKLKRSASPLGQVLGCCAWFPAGLQLGAWQERADAAAIR